MHASNLRSLSTRDTETLRPLSLAYLDFLRQVVVWDGLFALQQPLSRHAAYLAMWDVNV